MQSGLLCQARFFKWELDLLLCLSRVETRVSTLPAFYMPVFPVFFTAGIAVNRFIFAVAPADGAHGLRTVIYFFAFGHDCHFMAFVAPANIMYLFNTVNAHIIKLLFL